MSRIRTTKQAVMLRAVVIQRRIAAFAACIMGDDECPKCREMRARDRRAEAFLATRRQINEDEKGKS